MRRLFIYVYLTGMSRGYSQHSYNIKVYEWGAAKTGPDGAVVMSSGYGLAGTGFASRYRLQPRAGFFKGHYTLFSLTNL